VKFLIDRCAGRRLAEWLRQMGHDVIESRERGADPGDRLLLEWAVAEDRILVTMDKDFGDFIFVEKARHSGMVRLPDVSAEKRIELMDKILRSRSRELSERAILYVILDIFSRYVVGWMVAYRESAHLAKRLIEQTVERQQIEPGKLTLHADRGSSMTSKPVAFLLAELGVTKTHSRPHVSNDDPYSESQFKTLKYRPEFPERFGSYQDARGFCGEFFPWYNHEHHHSGLGFLTPSEVHFGQATKRQERRALVLRSAFEKNPERFVRGLPTPPALPEQVWINKPRAAAALSDSEALGAVIGQIDNSSQKNGFHNCPISNAKQSGRDLPMGQNQVMEDFVQ